MKSLSSLSRTNFELSFRLISSSRSAKVSSVAMSFSMSAIVPVNSAVRSYGNRNAREPGPMVGLQS